MASKRKPGDFFIFRPKNLNKGYAMTAVSLQTLPDGRMNVRTCGGMGRVFRPAAVKRLIRTLIKQGNRKTVLRGLGTVSGRDLMDLLG